MSYSDDEIKVSGDEEFDPDLDHPVEDPLFEDDINPVEGETPSLHESEDEFADINGDEY